MNEARPPVPGARRLLSAAAILFVARMGAMALGLLQAVLLASTFGTSAETDAFFVAYAVCSLFVTPAEGSLMIAFVPAFVHTAEAEGTEMAWAVAAGLFRMGLIGTAGIALLLAVSSPWLAPILAPGFDGVTIDQVVHFVRVLSPILVLGLLASFLATMDYVSGRYWLAALGMILNAMAGPMSLLLLADRFGVVALAWGLVAGAVMRCLVLILGSRRSRRLWGPAVPLRHPALRQIGRTIASRVMTTWFIDLNMMVDRMFASLLGPGYVSCLAYASKAVMAIVNAVVMPMGRTLMPSLSRLSAQHQYDRLRILLQKVVVAVGFVVMPMVAFVAFFRVDLLTVVFQRGAFDARSVEATAYALLLYGLGIVPFLMTPALNGVFFARGESRVPFRVGLVGVLANVFLDAVLMVRLGHGGIALATTLVAVLRTSLLWAHLQREIGALRSPAAIRSALVSMGAAVLAFWAMHLVVSLGGLGGVPPLWRLVASAAGGGAGYLLLQWAFNPQVLRLTSSVLRRGAGGAPERS